MTRKRLLQLLGGLAVAATGALTYRSALPALGARATGARRRRVLASPHYRDGRFQNLLPTPMSAEDSSMWQAAREYLAGGTDRVPATAPPRTAPHLPPIGARESDVTWFGHSAVLLRTGGLTLLIDPMFGRRASPFSLVGARRFGALRPADLDDLPPPDAVLFTHDHYDHLDHRSVLHLRDRGAHFFTSLGVGAHLERWGVDAGKITELDWWEETTFRGLTITAAPARHFSGRGLTDRQQTLWSSFAVRGPAHRIFCGGDSGYGTHFSEIGARLGPFDLTLLECGQYARYWPYVHMMPEQTARAHQDLGGQTLLPLHWGAFNLALHPWREPIERLLPAAAALGVRVATPRLGQTWQLGTPPPTDRWWESVP